LSRVLVTGGSGFIGSALVKQLLKAGNQVRVFDNNFRGSHRRLADFAKDVEFIQGDIRDADSIAHAANGVDEVHHLAFVNGTSYFYEVPELVLDVGVRGMINVIDACRRRNVPTLILASSSEVYQSALKVPADESVVLTIPDPLNPRYSYAAGKLISEVAYLGNVCFHVANYIVHFVRICLARSTDISGTDYPLIAEASVILAQIAGLGYVILLAILAWRWLKSDRNPLDGALIAFLVFVVGTAAATALGRSSSVGIVEHPTHARYTTPILLALACFVILLARSLSLRQARILFIVVAIALLPRQLSVLHSHAAQYDELKRAMNAVLENRDTEVDRKLLGNPVIVQRVANRLRAERLGPWESQR
jgi:hypothetical protein